MLDILTKTYWSSQYLLIDPKKGLPRPLKSLQTDLTCGALNFHGS